VATIIDNNLQVSEAAPVVEGVLADLARAAPEAQEAVRGLPFRTRDTSLQAGLWSITGSRYAERLGLRLISSYWEQQHDRERYRQEIGLSTESALRQNHNDFSMAPPLKI
jgi:hypothetical protein